MSEKNNKLLTKCYKCGHVYDSNFKRCPECNASNTLHTLSIIGICTVVALICFNISFTTIKVNEISNKLDTLNESIKNINGYSYQSDASEDTFNIMSASYYSNYEITDDNLAFMTEGVDKYILYFHQETCQYCLQANVFVNSFIELGFNEAVPVFFVTPDKADTVFDQYNVESTPTAIVIENGTQTNTAVGPDEIFTVFDNIVKSANN